MFCPGIGIAVDSCAALIALFDRVGVASTLVAVAGDNTEPADGTAVSVTACVAALFSLCAGLIVGAGGLIVSLSQALSNSEHAPRVITAKDVRMGCPLHGVSGNRRGGDFRADVRLRLCDGAHDQSCVSISEASHSPSLSRTGLACHSA